MQRFLLIIDTKLSTYLDLTLNQTVIDIIQQIADALEKVCN